MEEDEFEKKPENLDSTLRDIYEDFIEKDQHDEYQKKSFSAELKQLSEKVLRFIDRMLRMRRAVFFDNGYPFNRRFHREEFWEFAKGEFSDEEQAQGKNYDDVLEYLVDEQYLLFVESGSDSMYDVFQVVLV